MAGARARHAALRKIEVAGKIGDGREPDEVEDGGIGLQARAVVDRGRRKRGDGGLEGARFTVILPGPN